MLPSRKHYLDSIFDDFMGSMDNFDSMRCDIYEKDNFYYIEATLPGFSKEDISLDYKNGYITISAVRDSESDESDNDKKYIRKERVYGKTTRSFYIGNVSENEISAEFKNGILEVVVPKEEKETSKKIIEIK